jgi:hypothetical protein
MRAVRATAFAVLLATLGQACALRPRYRDFVTPKTEGKQVELMVTNGAGTPLPNVKVELSEWKNRLVLTTGPDGVLALPVDKKYLDENPVLVLQLPPGTSSYTLALAPPPLPPPLPPAAVPATEPAPAPDAAPSPTAPAPANPSGTTP